MIARSRGEPALAFVLTLFFFSGAAGVIYEVLWMRKLAALFGNTAHAAASTFSILFLGLAAGSFVVGRSKKFSSEPLRVFAMLEGAVALSALVCPAVIEGLAAIYPHLFARLHDHRPVLIAAKFLLSAFALGAPAFFMGGTLPIVAEETARTGRLLGRGVAMAYAVNTIGAAAGALVTGFLLLPRAGFANSYAIAIGLSVSVAACAWLAGNRTSDEERKFVSVSIPCELSGRCIRWLALVSGAVTLALEVLWIRMWAQVLQNSVYTFTIILSVLLLGLACGAGIASFLAGNGKNSRAALCCVLNSAGFAVALTPFLFSHVTENLSYIGENDPWPRYVWRVFWSTGGVLGIPSMLLGMVLPSLLKLTGRGENRVRTDVGNLAMLNMLAAVGGSLCAGFLLLETLGLWSSIRLTAGVLFLSGLILALGGKRPRVSVLMPILGFGALLSCLNTRQLPLLNIAHSGEEIVDVREGSTATVAVTRSEAVLRLKVNNFYTIGGSGAIAADHLQADLPMLLHPAPRSLFFLGLGTGITAGAALAHPIERMVVAEFLPEVVAAAKGYFHPYVGGLFEDKRVELVVEDGRNYLAATRKKFDVIIADLFVPWEAGTGSLYTREHFAAVAARLEPDGIFAQWLPLYQVSESEFGIIARTLLEVFPQVTLWRGDFLPSGSIALLVAQKSIAPLDPDLFRREVASAEALVSKSRNAHEPTPRGVVPARLARFLFYCGNIGASAALFSNFPLNTDDRPVIEFSAPITQRGGARGDVRWLDGAEFLRFQEKLQAVQPPESDPYLKKLSDEEFRLVAAGGLLHSAAVLEAQGDHAAAERCCRIFDDFVAGE